jgi:hypothetical protein
MTFVSLSRRLALLATIASSLGLASCGSGGGGAGTSNIRTLNLSTDVASIDLYIGGTKQFSSQATGVLSSFLNVGAASYSINVNSAGNATSLFTGTYTLAKDAHYTAIVWGPQASLRVSTLPEDDDTTLITAGNTKLRVFNATTETGTVDIYLTTPGADLTAVTPIQAALTSGSLAGFRDIAAGTYELRVTSVNNPTDVRLDIKSLTLGAGIYQTLVLTAGPGGTLVNGQIVIEQSTTTPLTNPQARVRLVAGVDNAGVVSANVAGTALSPGSLISPTVQGFYTSVSAGNVPLSVLVNGTPLLTAPGALTLTAGADYTLLVYGPPGNPQLVTITDDNRLPLSTARTKIRVVNGAASLDALSLSVDNVGPLETSYVVPGTASAYAQVTSNTTAYIEVDSPTQGVLYQSTRPNGDQLVAQKVYSVFVLSGQSKPKGVLSRDTP